jgi:hypothetical protein
MARPGPDRPVVSGGDRGAARVPCSPGEHDPGAASQAWIHSPLRRPLRPTDSADLYFFQPFIEIEPSEPGEREHGALTQWDRSSDGVTLLPTMASWCPGRADSAGAPRSEGDAGLRGRRRRRRSDGRCDRWRRGARARGRRWNGGGRGHGRGRRARSDGRGDRWHQDRRLARDGCRGRSTGGKGRDESDGQGGGGDCSLHHNDLKHGVGQDLRGTVCNAAAVDRGHPPWYPPEVDRDPGSLACRQIPGASTTVSSWRILTARRGRPSRTNGTGGRRYAAVWLRLGMWHASWSRRSALRFGHSQPGRARS